MFKHRIELVEENKRIDLCQVPIDVILKMFKTNVFKSADMLKDVFLHTAMRIIFDEDEIKTQSNLKTFDDFYVKVLTIQKKEIESLALFKQHWPQVKREIEGEISRRLQAIEIEDFCQIYLK